jgi:hypothetical protein
MITFVVMMLLGMVMIVLGIFNCQGNLRALHSYHYHRVTEADRLKFGRLVGLGTILMGVSVILYGVSFLLYERLQKDLFVLLGVFLLIGGLAVGMGVTFYAMKKYNKGIF